MLEKIGGLLLCLAMVGVIGSFWAMAIYTIREFVRHPSQRDLSAPLLVFSLLGALVVTGLTLVAVGGSNVSR